MTEPNDFEADEALLPGLGEPTPGIGLVEIAARRTIAQLRADELIDEADAVMCQALLTCAHQLDRAAGSRQAKDYGVANLIAQLRETFVTLRGDAPEGGGEDDPFAQLAADLRTAARSAAAGVAD